MLDKAKAIPALMQVAFLIQAIVSGAKEARPARTDRAPSPVLPRAPRSLLARTSRADPRVGCGC